MAYTAKFLSDEEFNRLPYKDIEVSLGIADPKEQTAYVRKSGVNAMDAFTLAHELDHLDEHGKGKHSDHYENGVYYKKANEWIQPIATGVGMMFGQPWVGPAVGAVQQRGGYNWMGIRPVQEKSNVVYPQQAGGLPMRPQEQGGGQTPPSIIQPSGAPGMAGGPSATGIGPDLMKRVREAMSGTMAGRSPFDMWGGGSESQGLGLQQGGKL